MPDLVFKDLCIDVTAGGGRPEAVARFWGTALLQPVIEHEGGDFHLEPPMGGSKERTIWINVVPEAPAGQRQRQRTTAAHMPPIGRAGAGAERARARPRSYRGRRRGRAVAHRHLVGRTHRWHRRHSPGHRLRVGGGGRRLSVHVLGVQPCARAQDHQEPGAPGREDGRRHDRRPGRRLTELSKVRRRVAARASATA